MRSIILKGYFLCLKVPEVQRVGQTKEAGAGAAACYPGTKRAGEASSSWGNKFRGRHEAGHGDAQQHSTTVYYSTLFKPGILLL